MEPNVINRVMNLEGEIQRLRKALESLVDWHSTQFVDFVETKGKSTLSKKPWDEAREVLASLLNKE